MTASPARRLVISPYTAEDQADVLDTLGKDPAWEFLTRAATLQAYKQALRTGITYTARIDNTFCGFIRALSDPGIAVYISELYVTEAFRNKGIGLALIQEVKSGFPDIKVYVLSDEDEFYQKKGYARIGSVFEV